MTETVNVPLTRSDGQVIGRAIVHPDGRVDAFIGPEKAELWRGYFKYNLAVSIVIEPERIPVRPALDIRPIYKKGPPPMIDDSPYTYMEKARTLVHRYITERLDKSDPPVEFTVYLIWFSKTLQNWKAMVSSTLPDGMYYEVTYDGEMKQTYINAYKKVENVKVTDNAFEQL